LRPLRNGPTSTGGVFFGRCTAARVCQAAIADITAREIAILYGAHAPILRFLNPEFPVMETAKPVIWGIKKLAQALLNWLLHRF
jgi:hypothetical protein